MNSRFVVPILCAAAIAFACGPRSHAGDAAAAATAAAASPSSVARHPSHHAAKGPVIASSLDVRVAGAPGAPEPAAYAAAKPVASTVTLTLHVTNDGDEHLEINFPSGQTHDFVVLDSTGRAVWRWSADRMFTQALQNRLLDAGETASFDGQWDAGTRRGRFTAVATLRSNNHPVESRVEFTLP